MGEAVPGGCRGTVVRIFPPGGGTVPGGPWSVETNRGTRRQKNSVGFFAAEQEEPLEIRVGADEVKEEDLEGDDDEPINADLEWETTASKLREAEKSAAAADAAERKAKLAAEPYDNPLLEHVRSNVMAEHVITLD